MSKLSDKPKQKLIYSKFELINKWLELYPNDRNHKNLEDNALAGYRLTEKGYVRNAYFQPIDLVLR